MKNECDDDWLIKGWKMLIEQLQHAGDDRGGDNGCGDYLCGCIYIYSANRWYLYSPLIQSISPGQLSSFLIVAEITFRIYIYKMCVCFFFFVNGKTLSFSLIWRSREIAVLCDSRAEHFKLFVLCGENNLVLMHLTKRHQ